MNETMDYAALSQYPGWIAAALVAIFLSGVLRGFSGFGASLFSVPVLSLMFAPSDVAPIMMGVQILSGLQTFSSDRHFIDWSCVTPMALASSVTAIIGVLALIKVDTDQGQACDEPDRISDRGYSCFRLALSSRPSCWNELGCRCYLRSS